MWIGYRKAAVITGMFLQVVLCNCSCSGEEEIMTLERAAEVCVTAPESSTEVSAFEESACLPENDILIYVHVCGEVVSPGVVAVPGGSRVETVIAAAGGFTQEADCNYLNLAATVADGIQLYVPAEGESDLAADYPEGNGTPGRNADGLIDLNTADRSVLCSLPGIGEKKASDIIAYRTAYGPFETKEDIMCVSGIKKSTYDKIKDLIIVR